MIIVFYVYAFNRNFMLMGLKNIYNSSFWGGIYEKVNFFWTPHFAKILFMNFFFNIQSNPKTRRHGIWIILIYVENRAERRRCPYMADNGQRVQLGEISWPHLSSVTISFAAFLSAPIVFLCHTKSASMSSRCSLVSTS